MTHPQIAAAADTILAQVRSREYALLVEQAGLIAPADDSAGRLRAAAEATVAAAARAERLPAELGTALHRLDDALRLPVVPRAGEQTDMIDPARHLTCFREYRENVQTGVHPGYMTDWQQPLVVLLTQATGASVIHEAIYEDRFGYTRQLNAMGATIALSTTCLGGRHCRFAARDFEHSAVVSGPTPLAAADLEIPDLRAGFAYVMAALVAPGKPHQRHPLPRTRLRGPRRETPLHRRGHHHRTDPNLTCTGTAPHPPGTIRYGCGPRRARFSGRSRHMPRPRLNERDRRPDDTATTNHPEQIRVRSGCGAAAMRRSPAYGSGGCG